MKNNCMIVLALAAMLLGLVSCENGGVRPERTETVKFTLELSADEATKAISDGSLATELQFFVYDEEHHTDGKPNYLFAGKAKIAAGSKNEIEIPLATGSTYSVIFWADAFGGTANSPYTYDSTARTISIDYSKMLTSNDNSDAFFAYQEPFSIPENGLKTVILRRPFAQINIGTKQEETVGEKYGMKVSGVYSRFRLFDGIVEGTASEDVVFTPAGRPSDAFPFQSGTYQYLVMGYVLAGNAEAPVSVTLTDETQDLKTFSDVKIQRNYRTNIYGSLLSGSGSGIIKF